jgi:hypothetical protein
MGIGWIILIVVGIVWILAAHLISPIIIKKSWFVPPSAAGWTLAPFIIYKKEEYATDVNNNHELIHIEQQKELMVIPFFILYILNFIINIFRMNSSPYRNIMFEKEAYTNEGNANYLKTRKRFNYFKLF